jgi:type IV pilus assembly protein PilN
MIRINLLSGPRQRQAKPQWDVRAELLAGAGVLLVTLAGCWWYADALDTELITLQTQKAEKEKHVAQLKEQVKQVDDFEKKKKLLEDKNQVIDQLEKSRSGPVRTLDYISQSLDPLKVWLVGLDVAGNKIELDGRALSNDDVVDFWNNLRRTDFFTNIVLKETKSAADNKINIYHFRLTLYQKG